MSPHALPPREPIQCVELDQRKALTRRSPQRARSTTKGATTWWGRQHPAALIRGRQCHQGAYPTPTKASLMGLATRWKSCGNPVENLGPAAGRTEFRRLSGGAPQQFPRQFGKSKMGAQSGTMRRRPRRGRKNSAGAGACVWSPSLQIRRGRIRELRGGGRSARAGARNPRSCPTHSYLSADARIRVRSRRRRAKTVAASHPKTQADIDRLKVQTEQSELIIAAHEKLARRFLEPASATTHWRMSGSSRVSTPPALTDGRKSRFPGAGAAVNVSHAHSGRR